MSPSSMRAVRLADFTWARDSRAACGVAVERPPRHVALHADQRQVMAHAVVEVAGDPQPLLRDPSPRFLIALEFRQGSALLRLGEVGATVAGGVARRDGQAAERGEGEVLRAQLVGRF